MVKHIVFFKLTKFSSLKEKQVQVKRLDETFSPLGLLPFIVDFKTGINYNEATYAWDFVIDSVFSNKEDLEKYMESEEHLKAVKTASEIEKNKVVIDYEF
jgi:Stress responsive A/B Barrel Domain.